MASSFAYSLASDTANGVVSAKKLDKEIRSSSITVALDGITVGGDVLTVMFKADISAGEETTLDGIITAHDGIPTPDASATSLGNPVVALENTQDDGVPKFVQAGRLGSEVIYATHDFADATTWYSESERATEETLTDSGDGLTFNSVHSNWIDMTHGKIMDEEAVAAENEPSHLYGIVITVDDSEMTQRTPYATSGGDYDVDYVSGDVTFFASQAGKTVVASYSYEAGSAWIMRPTTGKQLKIESAEAQFSKDVVMNDTIRFGAWGVADHFAPNYVRGSNELSAVASRTFTDPPGSPLNGDRYIVAATATGDWTSHEDDVAQWNGSSWDFTTPAEEDWTTVAAESMFYTFREGSWGVTPYPSGTLIELIATRYQRLDQIIDEALGSYPVIPVMGGSARGNSQERYGFPFRYGAVRVLDSAALMELRVSLESNSVYGGERATATFYCSSEDSLD